MNKYNEIDENVEVDFNGMNIVYSNSIEYEIAIELIFPSECYNQEIIAYDKIKESEPTLFNSSITVDTDERREFAKQGHKQLLKCVYAAKVDNDLYMTALTINMFSIFNGSATLKYST